MPLSRNKGKQVRTPEKPDKPKVLAPGLFSISTKYVPPPRRENWIPPTTNPRKKQVTFREPPKPSQKPSKTRPPPVLQTIQKPNQRVHVSTGVKPASGASKPQLKRVPQPIKSLPAKQESRKRVEVHHRNLNKTNRVDSRLNIKPAGFVSDSIAVCKLCDKCLFDFNHDKCVVRYLNSLNAKPSSTKHVSIPTKQV